MILASLLLVAGGYCLASSNPWVILGGVALIVVGAFMMDVALEDWIDDVR